VNAEIDYNTHALSHTKQTHPPTPGCRRAPLHVAAAALALQPPPRKPLARLLALGARVVG
jgi:hypothetical protein